MLEHIVLVYLLLVFLQISDREDIWGLTVLILPLNFPKWVF